MGNCEGLLEPDYCRNILPREVFDRWGDALCRAMILGSERFYCPFKDCSMLLIDDGGQVVKESECPNCRRLFCAQCKVPWHTGVECAEFQRLHKDEREREDIMLMKLAKDNKWARCPKCRFVIERTQGCRSMRCRLVCFPCFPLYFSSSNGLISLFYELYLVALLQACHCLSSVLAATV